MGCWKWNLRKNLICSQEESLHVIIIETSAPFGLAFWRNPPRKKGGGGKNESRVSKTLNVTLSSTRCEENQKK